MKKPNNKDINKLVKEYRKCKVRIRKNEIYTIISNKYLPKIYADTKRFNIQQNDKKDYISLYHCVVLGCITNWNETAAFTTYLFSNLRTVLTNHLRQKHKYFSKKHYHILSDNLDSFSYESVVDYYTDQLNIDNVSGKTAKIA